MKILRNPHTMTFNLTIGDWKPSKAIQKIGGFTRGLSFHRVDYPPYWHISNSIVLGYNRASMQHPVRLFMYAYVNGKNEQRNMGDFKVGTKLDVMMVWSEIACAIDLSNDKNTLVSTHAILTGFKTLPICWLLQNYAEIDNTNKQTPFHCPLEDLRVNGRKIK